MIICEYKTAAINSEGSATIIKGLKFKTHTAAKVCDVIAKWNDNSGNNKCGLKYVYGITKIRPATIEEINDPDIQWPD